MYLNTYLANEVNQLTAKDNRTMSISFKVDAYIILHSFVVQVLNTSGGYTGFETKIVSHVPRAGTVGICSLYNCDLYVE